MRNKSDVPVSASVERSASPAKSTPGPWQPNGSHIYGPDPGRVLICQLSYGSIPTEERDANARLILAAPDLLEALKMVRTDFLEFEGCYCGQIVGGSNSKGEPLHVCGWCTTEAAIAKAEGRS